MVHNQGFQSLRSILAVAFWALIFAGLSCESPLQTESPPTPSTEEHAPDTGNAADKQDEQVPFATLTRFTGDVTVTRSEKEQTLKPGDALLKQDILSTGFASRAEIRFADGSLLRLACDSRLELREIQVSPAKDARSLDVKLLAGKLWANVSKFLGTDEAKNQVWVRTQSIAAGVRGTVFQVAYGPKEEAIVRVYHGQVSVSRLSLVERARPDMTAEEIADTLDPERRVMVSTGQEVIAETPIHHPNQPKKDDAAPGLSTVEFDPVEVAMKDRDWLAYNLKSDRRADEENPEHTRTDAYRFLPKSLVKTLLEDAPLEPRQDEKPARKQRPARKKKKTSPKEGSASSQETPRNENPNPADAQAKPQGKSRHEEAADDYLNSAAQAERQVVEAYYRSIYQMMKKGQLTRARMNLENYIMEHPGWESIIGRYYLARCLAKQGETTQAIKVLDRALKKFPRGKWAKRMRGYKRKLLKKKGQ